MQAVRGVWGVMGWMMSEVDTGDSKDGDGDVDMEGAAAD